MQDPDIRPLCLICDDCLSPVPSQPQTGFCTLLSARSVPDLLLREMGQDPAGAPATMGINNHPVQGFCEHQAAPLLPLSIRLQSWELGPCSEWLLFLCPYPHSEPCPALPCVQVLRPGSVALLIELSLEGGVSTKQLVSVEHLLCVLQG